MVVPPACKRRLYDDMSGMWGYTVARASAITAGMRYRRGVGASLYRSLHCLPTLPGSLSAITDHD